MVGGAADVADALDDNAARPETGEAGDHGEGGDDAEGLDQDDEFGNGLEEIAQMAQEDDRQRDMKDPAEQPDPFVRLEKAFEQRDFAQHPQRHAALGFRRGRRSVF